jgi:hypothetical protein
MAAKSSEYILIGNFGLDYDSLKGKFLDSSGELKFREFFSKIEALSKALGVKIVDFFDDSVVLEALEEDKEYLTKYLGKEYCCVFIDGNTLSQVKDVYTHKSSTDKPGYVPFKNRATESRILLKPKNFTYDA